MDTSGTRSRINIKRILLGLVTLPIVVFFFIVLAVVSDEGEKANVIFFEATAELLTPIGRATNLAAVSPPSAAGNFDWTIVGSIFNPQNGQDTLAWWEPTELGDISNWRLIEPSNSLGKLNQRFLGLITGTDIQIAVGSEGKGEEEQGAAWYRKSRGEWQAVNSQSIDGASRLIKVDISPSGQVITFGIQLSENKDIYGLWRSSDGKKYSKVDLEFAEGVEIRDVVASEQGFIAVGNGIREDGMSEGQVWVSEDGKEWRSVSGAFSQSGNVELTGVATNGSGFVITGGIQNGPAYLPMAWISENLDSWISEGIFFDEGNNINRLSNVGNQVAGVSVVTNSVSEDMASYISFSSSGNIQQVWVSVNGRSWAEIGDIKGFRETGVPVTDAGLVISGSSVSAVAITSDIGIWTYKNTSSWREVDFRGNANQVLPRIEDGPFVADITWDSQNERFVAAGIFDHAVGEESLINQGGRFWESSNLGRHWTLLEQFQEAEVGGPALSIASGEDGLAAVGVQDQTIFNMSLSASDRNEPFYNPNSQGIFWNTDEDSELQQFVPYDLECRMIGCNNGLQDPFLKTFFFDIAVTKQGYILGGGAFIGISSETTDGLVYLVNTQSDSPSYYVVDPADIGLESSSNASVWAVCSSRSLDRLVVLGSVALNSGSIIAGATSSDGEEWTIAQTTDNSFEKYEAQQITTCESVPIEVCNQPDTIFKNLEPCTNNQEGNQEGNQEESQNQESFFVAAGFSTTKGETDARVWWSSDGRLWESLDLPEEFSSAGEQVIVDVVANARGVIFVGNAEVTGVLRGHIWMEAGGTLEARSADFGDLGISTLFHSAAISPENYLVVAGSQDDGRLAKIWYSQMPVFP